MRRIITALMLLALTGCANFEATGPGSGPTLEFTARAAGHGQWLEQPEVTTEGKNGRIEVRARLSTPDPCRSVLGSLDAAGTDVTLRVAIHPAGTGACVGVIGTFEYDAALRGLAPGSYRLRVLHEYPQTGWPSGPVLDQQVEVR